MMLSSSKQQIEKEKIEKQYKGLLQSLKRNRQSSILVKPGSGRAVNQSRQHHISYLYSKMPKCTKLSESVLQFPQNKIILGEGAFGCVQLAHFKTLQLEVAVKVMKKERGSACYVEFEASVMQSLCGSSFFPYVFGVYGNCLVMELLAPVVGGSHVPQTISRILKRNDLGLKEWINILNDVASGISYMHGQSILHNDIKCDNILLVKGSTTGAVTPKIIDFGKATHMSNPVQYKLSLEDQARYNEFHRHLAHELRNVHGSYQSKASDIYSFGYVIKSIAYQQSNESLKALAREMKTTMPSLRIYIPKIKETLSQLLQ